jgi:hypothetical protein
MHPIHDEGYIGVEKMKDKGEYSKGNEDKTELLSAVIGEIENKAFDLAAFLLRVSSCKRRMV